MACLCAPTTHEGSFRCRLHRVPTTNNSAELASLPTQKGAFTVCPLPPTISDQPYRIRARESSSPAASPVAHLFNCNFPLSSSSSSSTTTTTAMAATLPPSPPSTSCYARPPQAKRAVSSSSISLSRSLYPGSSKSELMCSSATGPSARHAAAMAIMKQHSHNHIKHSKSHGSPVLRSSVEYKIGPSRLSRMGRACADEAPLLKKVDCCTPNPPPQNTSSGKPQSRQSTSINVGKPQSRQSISMEATHINFKMRSTIEKFKQSESSCKTVGYKAGQFIMPIVY